MYQTIRFFDGDEKILFDVREIEINLNEETFKLNFDDLRSALLIRSMDHPIYIRPKAENSIDIEPILPDESW